MPSTYSSLKFELMATGENNTTWGTTTNVNLGTAIEEAIVGSADVTFASANVTLTLTDTNASQAARNLRLRCIGTTGGARNLIVPSIEKPYIVRNECADAITVKNATGTGVAVPAGATMWVYNDGTNVVDAVTYLTTLSLSTPLGLASGGTGAGTAATARANLGSTTLGDNLFTIANPSAVTFPRFNADNTVSALDAASFRTAIGAGSGTGTVTSVALSLPAIFTVTGSPITSSGTLTATLASQTANLVFASPNGSSGAPTFRALVAADIPNIPATVSTVSASFTAATSDNNTHKIASGTGQTLTLNSTPATGTGFTLRFTTTWSIACSGGLSKNGAAPGGITSGTVAANSLITFLHEGSGVWLASGSGLT